MIKDKYGKEVYVHITEIEAGLMEFLVIGILPMILLGILWLY
jgi:cold shock CspA family protein